MLDFGSYELTRFRGEATSTTCIHPDRLTRAYQGTYRPNQLTNATPDNQFHPKPATLGQLYYTALTKAAPGAPFYSTFGKLL